MTGDKLTLRSYIFGKRINLRYNEIQDGKPIPVIQINKN
jgi:hypothetical protein